MCYFAELSNCSNVFGGASLAASRETRTFVARPNVGRDCPMEIPLTPIEFARRARRLYANREAVVDGELRLTYAQFFERCDRWSAALQAMGVRKGDRVAYIAPNTHAHLEAYYAVPQIAAALVPINYRLLPDDFEYIINHCGAKVVCVHSEYIEAVEGIRGKLKEVEYFVALEGTGNGWINYETT